MAIEIKVNGNTLYWYDAETNASGAFKGLGDIELNDKNEIVIRAGETKYITNKLGNIIGYVTIRTDTGNNIPIIPVDKMYLQKKIDEFKANVTKMPNPDIVDYKWNAETGTTYIKWSDKTETTVRAEDTTTADQFVGFIMCYAKRAAGNTSRINNLYDKWAVRKPIQDKKAEAKALAEKKEKDRIASKRKKEREEYLVYREVLRIKRDYEARKLANEKFGVPMEDMG